MKNRYSRNDRRDAFGVRPQFRWAAAVLVAFALLLAGAARAADAPLVFGVFPNLTARQALKTYAPLAGFLERQLGRRVVIYTAPDFPTFVARTREGVYDLVLTAPHLAWLARQDAGYRPLLKYSAQVRGLLITRNDNGLVSLEALRGRSVAITDALALATLAIEMALAQQGIVHGRDYTVHPSGSHTNAIAQVLAGRVDAAIVGIHPYRMQPETIRAQLRILLETPSLSSLTYLAHPRLRDRDAEMLRAGLLAFAESPEGRAFLADGGYGGLVAAEDSELGQFHEYALRAQGLLRERR